jgi:protein SCO1/2
MKKVHWFLYVAISVLLAACGQPAGTVSKVANDLPFYSTPDFTPQWIDQTSGDYSKIHVIRDFNFINQYGEAVSNETFKGKIYVADFFFTSCPGICKRLTASLLLVQKAFAQDSNVLLISHSVTPETDDVKTLFRYAVATGVMRNKWQLVTGDHDKIYSIARDSYFADEDLGLKKSTKDFLHTENVLLIDKHKRIRGVYKGTSLKDIDNLIADIKMLEAEE